MRNLLIAASAVAVLAVAPAACAAPAASPAVLATAPSADMQALLDYVRDHGGTGFIVIENGKTLIDEDLARPGRRPDVRQLHLRPRVRRRPAGGRRLAAEELRGDPGRHRHRQGPARHRRPGSKYLGAGWSKASPEQEARIRVIDVLTMSSGLNEQFGYVAPAGSTFFYNTPVYAISKRMVAAAAGQPLEAITRDWLTAPTGMKDTAWRQRPAALASVGNATGLVTTPHDVARFGLMVLHGGVAEDGKRVVSKAQLDALFTRSAANPAYGRLWWLNGADYTLRAQAGRREGQLIPAAPADLVGALGAFDRRLYVVPSRKLVVVRTGAAANDTDFDQQLWLRLMKVIG
jgi:hypothetical protein